MSFQLTDSEAIRIQRALFARALDVVGAKRADYGGGRGPLVNFYAASVMGVEPWRGALVRLMDKLSRLRTLAERGGQGQVKGESLVDTAVDAVNYCVLAFLLILEALPEDQALRIVADLLAEGGAA